MSKQFKAGIIGGAGYTGGETTRILLNHPKVDLAYVHSKSQAGLPLHTVHSDLLGDTDLLFSTELDFNVEVLFLCLGHGEAKTFLAENLIPDRIKIIDLSQDFRLSPSSKMGSRNFVYGLPELNKTEILKAQAIANPGCFATAIQLALLPLAKAGLLKSELHINATTGSTGAGQKPTNSTHNSWRNNNLSAYKAFEHQHLGEIGQSITQLQPDFNRSINLIPQRGAFTRGILATVYLDFEGSEQEAQELYKSYYADHVFTHVADGEIHLKQVVNTNKCIIGVEKHGHKLMITSIIDNLLKGASGQAVQNMNLMLGLPEDSGLRLKGSAY